MSAFKKLQSGDSLTVGYQARKQWFVSGSEISSYNIKYLDGITGSLHEYAGDSEYSTKLNYRSLQHLYYSNKADGSVYLTGSYDNYQQTTLYFNDAKNLSNSITSISLPRNIIGSHIKPSSLKITTEVSAGLATIIDDGEGRIVSSNDLFDLVYGVYEDEGIDYSSTYTNNIYLNEFPKTGLVSSLSQGKEGTLYGFYWDNYSGSTLGDVTYTHGTLNYTDSRLQSLFSSSNSPNINWTSNYDVFTTTYNLRIQDSEFNLTQNPSANSGSLLNDNVTGSEFSPYITTVGLYNDASELIAVAKLSRPIPKSKSTDMTIVINLDM